MPKEKSFAQKIDTALVVGAGIMGHGIAQLLAQNNIKIHLVDQANEFLNTGYWSLAACHWSSVFFAGF
jgi:3-hydroxyacyl-CoA dehydrogenase